MRNLRFIFHKGRRAEMHRSKEGTRFARVKDVPNCFFPRSNGHPKPHLGAAAQKKN